MEITNVYADAQRSRSYARLEFPGTYYLAFRDLPGLLHQHVRGSAALHFGCGTGRSTRFLKRLGFDAVGIDIAAEMIAPAQTSDPDGDYRLVADGELGVLPDRTFDLILAAFTFDNIPTDAHKLHLLSSLRVKLKPDGRLVNLVSSPEIYVHEWASFTTSAFPENRNATDGATVRIVMLDVADARPVEDVLCTDDRYRRLYEEAHLKLLETHRPLGTADEPFEWKTETHIAPWSIYILGR